MSFCGSFVQLYLCVHYMYKLYFNWGNYQHSRSHSISFLQELDENMFVVIV